MHPCNELIQEKKFIIHFLEYVLRILRKDWISIKTKSELQIKFTLEIVLFLKYNVAKNKFQQLNLVT